MNLNNDPAWNTSGIVAVQNLFGNAGINYWLDSGSLLGLIRQGQEIAWDSDVDVGVWDDEVPKIQEMQKKLGRTKGLKFVHRSYKGMIYGFTIADKAHQSFRPINIHVYFRHKEFAWSPQTVSCYSNSMSEKFAKASCWHKTRSILLYCREQALNRSLGSTRQKLLRSLFFYPVWGAVVLVRNRFDRSLWEKLWPYSSLYAIYTWIIPAKYFDHTENMKVNGLDISVPCRTEEYLAKRYGDWKKLVQNWNYWTDDGCISPQNPENLLPKEVFSREHR